MPAMNEAEVRQLSNQDLADLEMLVRAESDRRSRLSSASAEIAGMLKRVKADGGDPDQVVSEAYIASGVGEQVDLPEPTQPAAAEPAAAEPVPTAPTVSASKAKKAD